MNTTSLVGAALLALSVSAFAQAPAMKGAGGVMTDAKGMTLYTFDKDAGGKSACNGWVFWHFERAGKLTPIDVLRTEARRKLGLAGKGAIAAE